MGNFSETPKAETRSLSKSSISAGTSKQKSSKDHASFSAQQSRFPTSPNLAKAHSNLSFLLFLQKTKKISGYKKPNKYTLWDIIARMGGEGALKFNLKDEKQSILGSKITQIEQNR